MRVRLFRLLGNRLQSTQHRDPLRIFNNLTVQVIEVFMDGEKVDLPNIESVVVLNIQNWGAGVKPWTLGSGHLNYPINSYNDKKLEVFCVYSSFHIAQMQVSQLAIFETIHTFIKFSTSTAKQLSSHPSQYSKSLFNFYKRST